MAGIEQDWDTSFELLPATSSSLKDLPQQVQNLKVSIGDRQEREHEWESTGSGQHKAGSAKAYTKTAATLAATTRPDGTALSSADAGRIAVISDEYDAVKVYDGSAWKYPHEGDAIDDSVSPTGTLASLQDKVDALAAQIKAITHTFAWNASPTVSYLHKAAPTYSEMYNVLSSYLSANGDRIPVHGAMVWDSADTTSTFGDIRVFSYAERISSSSIRLYSTRLYLPGTAGTTPTPLAGYTDLNYTDLTVRTDFSVSFAVGF